MMGHPAPVSDFRVATGHYSSYDLVETLGSSETSWTGTNYEDIDVATFRISIIQFLILAALRAAYTSLPLLGVALLLLRECDIVAASAECEYGINRGVAKVNGKRLCVGSKENGDEADRLFQVALFCAKHPRVDDPPQPETSTAHRGLSDPFVAYRQLKPSGNSVESRAWPEED